MGVAFDPVISCCSDPALDPEQGFEWFAGVRPRFEAKLLASLVARGSTASYANASGDYTRTVKDHEGLIRYVKSGEARFKGARRVENLIPASQDFSDSSWAINTNMSLAHGVSDPKGGTTASTLTADSANAVWGKVLTGLSGEDYGFSIWVKRRTGTGTIQLVVGDNVAQTIPVTSEWQRFFVTDETSSTAVRTYVAIVDLGDEVDIAFSQLEEGDSPSEYVASDVDYGAGVTGVRYFAYQNGNTVS